MNDTLDVLRYWLPEWKFGTVHGGHIGAIEGCQAFSEYDRHMITTESPMHTAFLCADLRRKYLERGYGVSTYLYPDGQAQLSLARPYCSFSEHSTEVMDTELLATIAAGRALKIALEPGEGT